MNGVVSDQLSDILPRFFCHQLCTGESVCQKILGYGSGKKTYAVVNRKELWELLYDSDGRVLK